MLNLRPTLPALSLGVLFLAVPALAQAPDTRQVISSENCKVEMYVEKEIPPLGMLRITDDAKKEVATLASVGDSAILAAHKVYAFTFIRKGNFSFQGYDFWLRFMTGPSRYQCHIVSKRFGDKITVTEGSWNDKRGEVLIQTTPGKPLLAIGFPK